MRRRVLLLSAIGALWAGGLRAEIWCSSGSLTVLNHPCGAVSKAAASATVVKYAGEWMNLPGVRRVESVTSKRGGEEIWVYVDEDFSKSDRSKIPASVGGVPVAIFPDFSPIPELGSPFGALSNSRGPEALNPSILQEREAAEKALEEKRNAAEEALEKKRNAVGKAYALAVNKYRERWLALPGVLGIGPSKCDGDGCDFGSVGIIVQRQFLDVTRAKIPISVDALPTVLIPQD